MSSFFEHFDTLTDPRVESTKLSKLSDILFITISAVLSGCDDWNEIELYVETKEEWLRKYSELPNGIPSPRHLQPGVFPSGSRSTQEVLFILGAASSPPHRR
jgi:hypothetical protein